FAEPAEAAWYRAHDIDQAAAEAAYRPYMARIQREPANNVPPELYKDPYPHDQPSAAKHEALAEPKPTPEEMERAKAILAKAGYGPPIAPEELQLIRTVIDQDLATAEEVDKQLGGGTTDEVLGAATHEHVETPGAEIAAGARPGEEG